MLGLFGAKKQDRRPRNGRASRPRSRPRTGAPPERPPTKRPPAWKAHGPDALGLVVLFGAILMALSLADAAGPVGRGLDWMLRGTFGAVAYGAPLATLLVALAAFVRREEAGRILIGTSLITVGLAGIVHLVRGTAALTGGFEGLATGGGALGAILAIPLRTYVGTWAGALACLFVGILGGLITTKTPLRRAAEATWRGLVAAVAWIVRTARTRMRARAEKRRTPAGAQPEQPPRLEVVRDPEGEEDEDAADHDGGPPQASGEPAAAVGAGDADGDGATGPVAPAPRQAGLEQATLDLKLPGRDSYKLPPAAMLRKSANGSKGGRGTDEVARVLERTLSDFGVAASVTNLTRGPTVTRFEIELAPGVKVSRVLRLSDDIAYALGSPDVRLIAPIPGKSAIGVEVPNRDRELVTMGDIVHSQAWKRAPHPLTCVLGKDIAGHPVVASLAEMPHVLIAGATGAGKSSCLNALITSLLMRARPDDVRMILIDPKMVELSHYDNLPHLLSPVVTHPKRAAETLGWVVKEMERRYEELRVVGHRNLELYNAGAEAGTLPRRPEDGKPREKLPFIAVFVDELADLMMVASRQVEDSICRIAQMARAVGIHLVVATQRPSVDVVTGLIKANIPSRIAFSVASQSDSRVVLDTGGADKLVGHGDMLYLPAGTSKARRVQGAYVTEKELEAVTRHVRAQAEVSYEEEVVEAATREVDDEQEETDPLVDDAMELIVRTGMGSTSMLQRRLKVGFSRAGRLMDLLERKGVVGPQEGSKARAVLLSPEQLDEMRLRAGR